MTVPLSTRQDIREMDAEITGTAIEASNNLKNINVTVKILQLLDKTKTIVEVKDGNVIKDIMK